LLYISNTLATTGVDLGINNYFVIGKTCFSVRITWTITNNPTLPTSKILYKQKVICIVNIVIKLNINTNEPILNIVQQTFIFHGVWSAYIIWNETVILHGTLLNCCTITQPHFCEFGQTNIQRLTIFIFEYYSTRQLFIFDSSTKLEANRYRSRIQLWHTLCG